VNHLGFEDPEEMGSQISKKPKGFGGEDPKSPREPLAATRDGVEEEKGFGFWGGGALSPLYRLETRDPDISN
jgi:hypothetical protein